VTRAWDSTDLETQFKPQDQVRKEMNVIDYSQHPAFCVFRSPFDIDVRDIDQFNQAYKQFC